MYPFFHGLLSDRKGGEIFTCFGPWHIGYILLTVAAAAAVTAVLIKKDREARDRAADGIICAAFGLYVLDFFLMPLAYGEIDIEKLPFHVCTAMCVMCFLSRRIAALSPWRTQFALLGLISNLVYLIYPAGVMWHAVHPLCYRVVQTLAFHGIMTVYGLTVLAFDPERPALRAWPRYLAVTAGMTVWALIGNTVYNGTSGGYDHFFNWFFVVEDPFGMIAPETARFVMPLLDTAVFFAAGMAVCAAAGAVRLVRARRDGRNKDPRSNDAVSNDTRSNDTRSNEP
jgi:hypothetical protein